MLATPEFWVLIAFLLLLGGAGRKILKHLAQLLDAHRHQVAAQLEEAERLHNEARSLLETYTNKHASAMIQSKDIVAFAEQEAKAFKKQKQKELTHFLKQKEKALLTRLTHEREALKDRLRQEISEEASKIVKEILLKDKDTGKTLTAQAIKKIANKEG